MKNKDFTERQIEIMEAATLRIDKFGIQELTIKNLASDLSLSEAALYRHFKSKNEILLGLLTYFILEMNERLALIIEDKEKQPSELLKKVIKVVVSSAIFCITFFIFPLICFSFYFLISPFFALRSQNHRTIFSDNKLVFVLT